MAEIGHFEWRGKDGEFFESCFSPGKAEAARCRHTRDEKVIAQTARGLRGAVSPLAGPRQRLGRGRGGGAPESC